MSGLWGVGVLAWAGLVALAAGVGLLLIRGMAPQLTFAGDVARALIVTSVGLALTDVAFAHGPVWAWWLSGFVMCAALHRWIDARSGLVLSSSVAALRFDPRLGTATPSGTLRVAATGGAAVHHVVNLTGRVRSCSVGAAWAGMPAC